MDKKGYINYSPDYAIPPGETVLELLKVKGMSQTEFAERTGRPLKTINEIIKGKAPITPETALQFERVLGVPANFWNNLEKNYKELKVKIEESRILEKDLGLLDIIPVKKFIKFGWINEFDNGVNQLKEILNYFSVASPKQIQDVVCQTVAFRQSKRIKSDPWLVAGWLRKGQITAQGIECSPFDRDIFLKNLNTIKTLTTEPMNPDLCNVWSELCSDAGVALVFVPEVPKLGVNGATYWLKDKAVIQLSLLYKYSDILWFSFFHEVGHILLHGKKDVFIENKNLRSEQKEKEADIFAANFLINPKDYKEFIKRDIYNERSLKAFSLALGINPGIVVGRLQHDKIIPYSHFSRLRTKLEWT